jgi:hypothetical protein
MSNFSIAVFPSVCGQSCANNIKLAHPDFLIATDEQIFDAEANVIIAQSSSATAVWLRHPQIIDWKLYSSLAAKLGGKWLHLLFHEHVTWEYNHYDGESMSDRFAPQPHLWDQQWKEPNPSLLVEAWGCNIKRVIRYLKPWDKRIKGRKAYLCRDHFRYGQHEQGFDFLRALTGIEFPSC